MSHHMEWFIFNEPIRWLVVPAVGRDNRSAHISVSIPHFILNVNDP